MNQSFIIKAKPGFKVQVLEVRRIKTLLRAEPTSGNDEIIFSTYFHVFHDHVVGDLLETRN